MSRLVQGLNWEETFTWSMQRALPPEKFVLRSALIVFGLSLSTACSGVDNTANQDDGYAAQGGVSNSGATDNSRKDALNGETVGMPNTGGTGGSGDMPNSGGSGGTGGSGDMPNSGGTGGSQKCVLTPPTKEDLRLRVGELSGDSPVTIDGTTLNLTDRSTQQARKNAVTYIKNLYESLGLTVNEHSFSGGTNFSVDLNPEAKKTFIVSAHFDSVRDVAGADDDATGIIGGWAVASALKDCVLTHNLRIVGFDLEEQGLLGSKAYANALPEKESILGLLQLEMLGYDSNDDGLFTLVDCSRPESAFLATSYNNAITQQGLNLQADFACTRASDHSSFWDVGIPAITVSELFFGSTPDSNPCYHQSCDQVGLLNFEYMHDLVQAAVHSTAELVEASAK